MSAAQDIALQEAFAQAFSRCAAAEAAQKLAAVPVLREKLADIRAAAAVTTAALLTEAETGAEREELRREAQKLPAEKGSGLAERMNGEDCKQTGTAESNASGEGKLGQQGASRHIEEIRLAAAGVAPAELANRGETVQRDQAGRTEMLDALERRCLEALLRGESVRAELRAAHCLTSLFAERVNEKLYDCFQDICLASEGEELFLVPDYREELETLLRETEE